MLKVGIPRTGSSLSFKGYAEISRPGAQKSQRKKTWNDLRLLQRRVATALQQGLLVGPEFPSTQLCRHCHNHPVTTITAGAVMGRYTGISFWLPEKEWRPHLLLPSLSKDFQRSNSHGGKFQGGVADR